MKILVKTPSRLHLGFFDFHNMKGRYGSVGVAIEKPNFIIEAKISGRVEITGSEKERALRYVNLFMKKFNLKKNVKIRILKSIPEHTGLGSGTQLALAIGTAISKLSDLKISTEDIARIADRGKFSGVGIYAFIKGGFIIDSESMGFYSNLPENWFWIVALLKNKKGLSGRKENAAFKNLPKVKEEKNFELLQIRDKIVKAVIAKDIISFGKAINELDKKNGEIFSKIQGSIYFSKDVENGINFLLDNGAYGAGQSSWGPGFYALVDGKKNAITIQNELKKFFNSNIDVFIARTNIGGAKTRWSEH